MNNKNSNWKLNVFAIAAALAGTITTASAQENVLEATVPFAFSVNSSTHLAAGTYQVSRKNGIWWVRSEDASQSGAIVAFGTVEGKDKEKPSLTFSCLRGHCQISAIHAGARLLGAEVYGPKLSKSDREELSVVNVPLQPRQLQAHR